MAYKKNNNSNNYNNSNSNNNTNEQFKTSLCVSSKTSYMDSVPTWIRGWKKAGGGISFIASPKKQTKDGKECFPTKSEKSGMHWMPFVARVTENGTLTWANCLWCLETQRLHFTEHTWIANPDKTMKGKMRGGKQVTGFFGNNYKKS